MSTMSKSIVIPADLIDQIDQRQRYLSKNETRMEKIERMLDEILVSKHLTPHDKRDQYIIILNELMEERNKMSQDMTIEIQSPNLSQTSLQTSSLSQPPHHLSQTSSPLTSSHTAGVRHNITGVSGSTPNISTMFGTSPNHSSSFGTPNLPSPFPGPQFVGMLPFASTPQSVTGDFEVLREELKKLLSDRTKYLGVNLLKYLQNKKHGKSINWNERGEVSIEGSRIPNSNIVNLIAHAVSKRNKTLPPVEGFERFATYLIKNSAVKYYGDKVKDFKKKETVEPSRPLKRMTDTPSLGAVLKKRRLAPKKVVKRKNKANPFSKHREIEWIPF